VVKDPTDAAIAQAMVQLLDARQFAVAAGRTDSSGQFRLQGIAPGSYELLISKQASHLAVWLSPFRRVKPRSWTLRSAPRPRTNRPLLPADMGIVQDVDQTSQRVNVIDEQQLMERTKAVLAQAAQEEAGLQLQRTSPTIGAIFVRGLTGAKVVTYVDGIRFLLLPCAAASTVSSNLNESSNLRAMEVLRGPNSAQYGSDSIGGAVQLLSRAPSFTADVPRLSQQLGTYFNSADLSFGGKRLGQLRKARLLDARESEFQPA